jgi:hypothetical protein
VKHVPFDRSWAASSWQGARDNTRRIGESMTLEEKLEWLESAETLAEELSRGRLGADQDRAWCAGHSAPRSLRTKSSLTT